MDISTKHIQDLRAIIASLGHVEAAIQSLWKLDDPLLLEPLMRLQHALIGHAQDLARQLKWTPTVKIFGEAGG
jgi:hypothetical protein